MTKNCPNCGNPMPEEASFCLNCFSEIDESEAAAVGLEEEIAFPAEKTKKIKFNLKPVYIRRAAGVLAAVMITLLLAKGVTMIPAAPKSEESGTESAGAGNSFFDKLTQPDRNTDSSNESGSESASGSNPQNIGESAPGYIPPKEDKPEPPVILPPEDIPPIPDDPRDDPNWGSIKPPVKPDPPAEGNGKPPAEGNTDSPTEGTTAPPAEKPTSPPKAEPELYEYTTSRFFARDIQITKYNGNAEHVLVPAKIDGKVVAEIAEGAFTGISEIKTITCEGISATQRNTLWLNEGCFTNLPNLTAVKLPNDERFGIDGDFAVSCPKLASFDTGNDPQNRCINGLLYYYNGAKYKLRFVCPGAGHETIIIPDWCAGFDSGNNLRSLTALKKIVIHKNVTELPFNSFYSDFPQSLECIEVEKGNAVAYSYEGALCMPNEKLGYTRLFYPPAKKDKVFKIPENVQLYCDYYVKNPYLETIYLPASSSVSDSNANNWRSYFKNLKTIYVHENNPKAADIKKWFYQGETIFYK